MRKLNKQELVQVTGGSITASFLNAMARGFDIVLEVGRSLGSALRRIFSGKKCSI